MKRITNHVVPFKGQRTYIQGPDLVDLALSSFRANDIKRAKLSSHRFICTNSVQVTLFDKAFSFEAPFRGTVTTSAQEFWISISEDGQTSNQPSPIEFNESLLTDASKIDGKSIHYSGASPFSFIETIVSLKKSLLQHEIPVCDAKWIFTSVDLKSIPEIYDQITINIDHNFQNKLVKSSIFVEKLNIGNMFFSLVQL